ncbi:MSEP-CTERM sorting domain-containing protein [Crassaminicella profunda]|uniref:MSEP-CTERM sorting domain-containing protein n=1 Tax=Crassaminicella profunda TaxID=1286698 RepID=UPI001CA6A19C|nr:MSEP-CTERM sorting domain-containing protein [Crassaminicella profunda]QZY55744.1 MSEP-CTERM sorting domain-containing protein [Crassaminicella profunda]
MNKLYKPYLIFVTLTIPQIFIFILYYKIFGLIHSELNESNIGYWKFLSLYLGAACFIFTLWNINNWIKKKEIQPLCAILIFSVYTIFLSVYSYKYTEIIPSNIPAYMFLGIRPGMTVLTLIMPGLIHSMLMMVHFTVEKMKIGSNSKDFYRMIGIPALSYLSMYILWGANNSIKKMMPILFIVSIIGFFFFFIRIIYRILKRKSNLWQKNLAFLNLVASVIGLAVNQGLGNIFGDFSHVGFYLFAVITGGLMLIPDRDNKRMRLVLWGLKSITFVFTFYFFLVFLPLLPFSLIGMIFLGFGILMLTPLVLMFLHVQSLWSDYQYLKGVYPRNVLITLLCIGILTIPVFTMVTIKNDKENLDKALTFTYERSYEDDHEANIDPAGVKRALKNIKYIKGNKREKMDLFTTDIPYFTALYHEYVLDGLSISSRKIMKLEKVFLGKSDIHLGNKRQVENSNENVFIKDIYTKTVYDKEEKVLKSWINLEIENKGRDQEEYDTLFKLPKGSYISNYYLYVGTEKKYGLIADKRAANWIYENTKKIRRDPGILTDIGNNHMEFKIFPFNRGEVRKTGIEIIHKGPITFNIDGHNIDLKDDYINSLKKEEILINQEIAYIPKEVKKKLEKTTREQKYYFVLDYSEGNENKINDYIKRVKDYIKKHHIEEDVKEIVAINFEEKRIPYDKQWEKDLKYVDVKGGFFLEYTVKRIIYENYIKNSSERPVIIVVTDDLDKAVDGEHMDDFSFACPEGVYYYHLDRNNNVEGYIDTNRKEKVINEVEKIPVFIWENEKGKTFYLSDTRNDSIVLLDAGLEMNMEMMKNFKWENGLVLQGLYMSYVLHPEKYYEKSLSIVKNSIMSQVMSPMTSFIVLENEAQEKVMLEKQKQILARKKPVHIGDMTEMDEPSLWMMLLIMIGIFLFREKKRKMKKIR